MLITVIVSTMFLEIQAKQKVFPQILSDVII